MDDQNKPNAEGEPHIADPVVTEDPGGASGIPNTAPVAAMSETPAKPTDKIGLLIGGFVVLAVLSVGWWFMHHGGAAPAADSGQTVERSIADDAVVATVNGVALQGELLNSQMTLLAQQAQIADVATLDDATFAQLQAQALDSIVNTELVAQAATAEGLSVTDADIDEQFDLIVEGVGGMEVAEARLAELGLSADEFKETLVNDILIQQYLELESTALDVTEAEALAVYEQVTQGQTEGVPAFADVRFQIEQQLEFQKQQEALASLIEELRAEADVELSL